MKKELLVVIGDTFLDNRENFILAILPTRKGKWFTSLKKYVKILTGKKWILPSLGLENQTEMLDTLWNNRDHTNHHWVIWDGTEWRII